MISFSPSFSSTGRFSSRKNPSCSARRKYWPGLGMRKANAPVGSLRMCRGERFMSGSLGPQGKGGSLDGNVILVQNASRQGDLGYRHARQHRRQKCEPVEGFPHGTLARHHNPDALGLSRCTGKPGRLYCHRP